MPTVRKTNITYVVINKRTGSRFSFATYPSLTVNLPPDFAEPGDVLTIQRVFSSYESLDIEQAVRFSDETGSGYNVTSETDGHTYTITFNTSESDHE